MIEIKSEVNKDDLKTKNALKPLLLLHLVFGYDYGLFQSKGVCVTWFIKILSTLTVFALPAIVLYLELLSRDLDILFVYPLQYFIEALTTTYIYGPRIINNLNKFKEIDDQLRITSKHYKRLKWHNIIYVVGLLCLTLAYMGSLSSERDNGLKASSLFLFVLDISFVLRLNFFDLVRHRVRKLRKYIEKHNSDELFEDVDKKYKLDRENYLPLYKKIADQLEDIDRCIGFLFTFSFTISLWKFITLIFDISLATGSDFKIDLYFVIMSCSLAIHTILFLGAPGLVGEMIIVEANKIKLSLADKLLRAPDEEEERYISRFMGYIDVRPLRFVIWRVIPLNITLFNSVISFCVTVFIFMMQFHNRMPFQHLLGTSAG